MSAYQIMSVAKQAIEEQSSDVILLVEAPIGAVQIEAIEKQPSGLYRFVTEGNGYIHIVRDEALIGVTLKPHK